MKNNKFNKSEKKHFISAISIIFIILSASFINIPDVMGAPVISTFVANPHPVDVGETVEFNWSISGAIQESFINFGDGNTKVITETDHISHEYTTQGSYQVLLIAIDSLGEITNKSIKIIVENEAPEFEFLFSNLDDIAYEDEIVNITIVNLVDSEVDMVPGVITYIYDFADGIENKISTNKSSVTHSWSNAGVYPVTVTAIDDQGALNQFTKSITIINTPPQARIGFEVQTDLTLTQTEYIATYDWRDCDIEAPPDGWDVSYIDPYQWFESNPTVIKVVEEVGIHEKVVKLQDNLDTNAITMEDVFTDQEFGSVEFWIKTNNTYLKTWSLSLWDDSDIAFQFLMDQNEWKYTTSNEYNVIQPFYSSLEFDNPNNNIWFHVRIDFCIDNTSGNYYNLESQQFRVLINDIQSEVYEIDNQDVLGINKILIQSSISAVGISYIDAMGYSWDPYYHVGDNRWPVTNYPDKSVFFLNGVNSTDSVSDIDSLRYYWQFGDGTSAYGKYVHHQYTESGLYRVTLTVKDNNGEVGSTTRFVSINNRVPDVSFTIPPDFISIYEGETVGFNLDILDDTNDIPSLEYWWNYEFNSFEVNYEDLSGFELGGWKSTHIYTDDYNGEVCVITKDKEGLGGYDTLNINVLNSDPSISIWDVGLVANTSVIITRSEVELDLNFTISLFANDISEREYLIDFIDAESNFIYTNKEEVSMSLLKDWKLVINSTVPIPALTWIKYDFLLDFSNGEELVISSGKFFGGSNASWEVDLNPYFYDNANYNFMYPITLSGHVWDPSNDEINVDSLYKSNSLLYLNCSPTTASYIYNLNGIDYFVDVFDQDGKAYANISFSKIIASEFYDDNTFPVKLDLDFSIDPLYDLNSLLNLLESDLGSGDLLILDCLEVIHNIYTNVTDDDGGTNHLKIAFDSNKGFEFYNLSAFVLPMLPQEASEIYNLTIYAEVFDYHLIQTLPEAMKYSRNITLNPATPQSNYQVKIELNPTNFNYLKVKSDGSDIRFYEINGTKLNYWIENWNTTGTSTIWVKIPTSNTSIINMVYGNQLVHSESNGSKVFIFFDDFNNNILDSSKWRYRDNYPYSDVSVSDGILRLYSYYTNPWATNALLGFHTAYIDDEMHTFEDNQAGAYFTPSEDIWVTGDFRWVNTSLAEYYENDVLFSNDTDITDNMNPVNLLSYIRHMTAYDYGCYVSSVNTSIGSLNRALRLKVWTNLSGLSEIKVDWLAVRKCSNYEPIASIEKDLILNCTITYNNGTGTNINEQILTLREDLSSKFASIFEGLLNFDNEGDYLIKMIANNGEFQTITGEIISIDLAAPYAAIGDLPDEIIEDQQIQLISDIFIFGKEELDERNYRFEWSFDDGTYSRMQNPIHSWSTSGIYNLTLFVVDCYGNTYIANKTVIIKEQEPEIRGPFTFQGIEGQATVLDLEIYDSFIDEEYLTYTWYDNYGSELSNLRNNKKPVVILDDGTYVYRLKVEDQDGYFDEAYITIIVEDLPPMVLTSNYVYSGPSGGGIKLKAYVLDYYNDASNMIYKWTLTYGNTTIVHTTPNKELYTTYSFSNDIDKMICFGEVMIKDTISEKSNVATFIINNLIDNNANGFPDDQEWMIEAAGLEFIYGANYIDTDGDNLIDDYETLIGTLPNNVDSDGDGLWDGYDEYGIGEYSAGTDPNNEDTDDDSLIDSIEIFGWNVITELFGVIHVTSDPLDNDTDDDGLFDGEEYNAGTNPHNKDTDSDGLTDNLDPFPLKMDGDEDGLSDYREYVIGTNIEISDTDGDNLLDGEEVFGWGFYTDPLDPDSDHDFLSDSKEISSSSFEIKERMDLVESITLNFDDYCSKAVMAQIYITLAFGEADTDNDYGVIDVPDLNVLVTKLDDNLLLFNDTTNKTRYFSKAFDIRELIENRSLDYRGEYEIRINDTSAGCLLEEFKVEVLKYLDPNDDDFDGDGIMDGVEMDLLVNGKKMLDINNTADALRGYYAGSYSFDIAMEPGLFYGTYDFNGEQVGTNGTAIDFVDTDDSSDNCKVEIISSLGNHKNVMELNDSSVSGQFDVYNNFTTSQNYGSIEFWVRTTSSLSPTIFSLRNGGINLLRLSIDNNMLRSYYDGSWHDIDNVTNDIWYHIRIDFRCSGAPAYKNLAENYYHIYLDGIKYENYEFENDQNSADRFRFYSDSLFSNYYSYIDAIGYSWDNWSHEELGYQDRYGYGGRNINPNDITLLLENDWDLFLNNPNVYVNQSDERDGHSSIIELYDNSDIGSPRIIQNFNESQSYGTIEWWWRTTNEIYNSAFLLQNYTGQSSNVILNISNGMLRYYNNGFHDICAVSNDIWYHIRVDFESTASNYLGLEQNTWCIYVNSVKYGDYNFNINITDASTVHFTMDTTQYGYSNYIDALGYSWDPEYNIADNKHDYIGDYDEYSLEIPYIGKVYDANLKLKLISDGYPEGNGNITIEIFKEHMNETIPDVLIFILSDNFSDFTMFIYEKTIDLSDLLPLMTNGYYGTYRLRLTIDSTYHDEIINVNTFIIETDTFVRAGREDTEAWITDPSKWDTDGDGWSDKYEIYDRSEPTNPLSEDSDGDGVWDKFDRDPLRDIIIEINPIYGHHRNLWFWESSPYLEITVGLESGGSSYLFCTPSVRAHSDRVLRFKWWFFGWHRYYHYRKSYFNSYYYYANIDDDIRTQGDALTMKLNLWQMGGLWDKQLISAYATYSIGSIGHTQTLSVSQRGIFRHNNYMQINVTTLGLDKVNTIAIYDNETIFNGHYQAQERMNIFQIYIEDSVTNLTGTPFELGPNVIVIPTSLFTDTILNKYVQDEKLNETVLYEDGKSEFISIERDGETEAACDDVDFVFVRFDISAEDAMEILEMLLTCLLNETTNQIGIAYNYSSTKEDGLIAVLLNLPVKALAFIPWLFDHQNSAQGRVPHTFLEWLIESIVSVVKFVVNLFIAIGQAIAAIWEQIVEVVGDVLMAVVEFLAFLLWCLIRAALLIFVWLMFSMTALVLTAGIAGLALAFLGLATLFKGTMYYTINSVGLKIGTFSLATGWDMYTENYEFFDILVPSINFWFSLGSFRIIDVTINFWPPGFEFYASDASSQETELIEMVTSSLGSEDIIAESSNEELHNQSIESINSPENSGFDVFKLIDAVPRFFKGMKTSVDWWSISIPIAIISLGMPSGSFLTLIKFIGLGISLATYIVAFFLELDNADLDEYETFCYLLGAGIMTIYVGYKFYDEGKPPKDPQDVCKDVQEAIVENGISLAKEYLTDLVKDKAKDFFKDMVGDFLKGLVGALLGIFGEDDQSDYFQEYYDKYKDVKQFIIKKEREEIFKTLNFEFKALHLLSYAGAVLPNFERDLKLFTGLTVAIGIVQIIIAGFTLRDIIVGS